MDNLENTAKAVAGLSEELAETIRACAVTKILDRIGELPDEHFLHIAALASQICETPVAAVSLIDDERTIYKALLTGSPNPDLRYCREETFCNLLTRSPDQPVIIYDAQADSQVCGLPFVNGTYDYLRFYSGLSLTTSEGYSVGTICVADRIPRRLRKDQEAALYRLRDLTLKLMGV